LESGNTGVLCAYPFWSDELEYLAIVGHVIEVDFDIVFVSEFFVGFRTKAQRHPQSARTKVSFEERYVSSSHNEYHLITLTA
jgi:hypothetical protein